MSPLAFHEEPPRFVVVGTGRHGSKWTAEVLTLAGIACGHEGWWNPTGERTPGLVGDSSWCALPWLPWHRGPVVHQVRHPLAVIQSWLKAPEWGAYLDLKEAIAGHHPDDTPLQRAMRWWVSCNLAAEARADTRWCLESGVEALAEAVAAAVGVDPRPIVRAGRGHPRSNWHGEPGATVHPEQLHEADPALYLRLVRTAGAYGYQLPFS